MAPLIPLKYHLHVRRVQRTRDRASYLFGPEASRKTESVDRPATRTDHREPHRGVMGRTLSTGVAAPPPAGSCCQRAAKRWTRKMMTPSRFHVPPNGEWRVSQRPALAHRQHRSFSACRSRRIQSTGHLATRMADVPSSVPRSGRAESESKERIHNRERAFADAEAGQHKLPAIWSNGLRPRVRTEVLSSPVGENRELTRLHWHRRCPPRREHRDGTEQRHERNASHRPGDSFTRSLRRVGRSRAADAGA